MAAGEPEGVIRGRVLDRRSGLPLAGASVVIAEGPWGTVADSSGYFAFRGVAAGRYRLEARMVGYRASSAQVEVGAVGPARAITEAVITLELVPIVLKEIAVTGQRTDRFAAERSPMFARVIPSEAFEGQATSLSEVLSRTSGVQVRTLGGLGSYSTISIRGTTSQQVKVYLDGIPLNSAVGGGVNLGDIPLSNVDRIEVYRGGIPARFGGGGIGGVVNIETTDISRSNGKASASFGSFGSGLAHGLFSRRGDHLGYVLGVDYSKSDNSFPFLDDNATPHNPDDDLWTKWQNNEYWSLTLLGKLALDVPGRMSLWLSGNLYRSDRGIPGTASRQSRFARLYTMRDLTEAHVVRATPLWEVLQLDCTVFQGRYVTDYRDLEGEVGLGKQHNHNVTSSYGARVESRVLLQARHLMSLFVRAQQERYSPTDKLTEGLLPSNQRSSYGWSLEDELGLFGGRLTLLGTVHWDRYENRFEGDFTQGRWVGQPGGTKRETLLSRHLGAKYELGRGAVIKANVGRYFRPPSFYELFGDKGWVIGNTKLEPESGLSRDLGGRVEGELSGKAQGALEISVFAVDLDDMIQFIQYSQKEVFRPENIGRALVRGAELMARCDLFDLARVDANYTYQSARDRTQLYGGIYEGKDLPNKPKHDFDARVEVPYRARGSVFYEYAAASATFRDRYNKVSVPRRTIHNLGARLSLSEKVHLTVEAKNLSDHQVADLWGHPLPGRSYYVTLRGVL